MEWKEQFLQMLGEPDTSKLNIDGAQMFKIRHMPKVLYKFRSPTDESLDNLANDTVWLSSASKYNDPFEFHDKLDYKQLSQAIETDFSSELLSTLTKDRDVPESVMKEALKSKSPIRHIGRYLLESSNIPGSMADEIFDKLEGITERGYRARYADKNRKVQEDMKVCSFSEVKEHLLMWGHYTGNHKGFCAEYDLDKWSAGDMRRRLLYPVVNKEGVYDATQHYVSSNRMKDFNPLFPIVAGSTKSPEWSYEKEWRFIFNIGESFEEQNYPMNCQSAVFLGHRMEADYRKKVLKVCTERQLTVYQAVLSPTSYEMTFEQK